MKLRRKELVIFAVILLTPNVLAWVSYAVWGVAPAPKMPERAIQSSAEPIGFPLWIRGTHYINLLFMVLLMRSGLQILFDHPRLYWNVHCNLGSEWLRLTPIEVPRDRLWTAKEDARYLTPWIGIPGGRHTIGMARAWHFLSVLFWVGNGLLFVVLLFATGQWRSSSRPRGQSCRKHGTSWSGTRHSTSRPSQTASTPITRFSSLPTSASSS